MKSAREQRRNRNEHRTHMQKVQALLAKARQHYRKDFAETIRRMLSRYFVPYFANLLLAQSSVFMASVQKPDAWFDRRDKMRIFSQ